MKKGSLNSITSQLIVISILTILPAGCARENAAERENIVPNTEIFSSNRSDSQQTNNETVEDRENVAAEINPTENVNIQERAELEKIETIVYFDFDSANLSQEGQEKLQQVADRIKNTDNNLQVLIEGHADERGSHQYNIELGHDRAVEVKEFLTSLGVNATLLSTESHGEHKPFVEGSHPEAWSQNRRVEFKVIEPQQASNSR